MGRGGGGGAGLSPRAHRLSVLKLRQLQADRDELVTPGEPSGLSENSFPTRTAPEAREDLPRVIFSLIGCC